MLNIGRTKIARLLPDRWITTSGDHHGKKLYLTFDDGPHPEYTPIIQELLDHYSIPGSFFCIGNNIDAHPQLARNLSDAGHLLANHSLKHQKFASLPIADRLEEIELCQSKIWEISPSSPKIFRAPNGKIDPVLVYRLVAQGWKIIHWSYDSLDYQKGALGEQLAVFDSRPVGSGDIILFHDDNKLAVELLKELIPRWLEQGYSFATTASLEKHRG